VNPEKKNLKCLQSEQNHLDSAICQEMLLRHSRPLAPLWPRLLPSDGLSCKLAGTLGGQPELLSSDSPCWPKGHPVWFGGQLLSRHWPTLTSLAPRPWTRRFPDTTSTPF
jgi:hypothetical protein